MQDIAVNKQRCHECPDPAVQEIIETKDEILFGESWVLLPGPQAGRYASDDKVIIDSQGNNALTVVNVISAFGYSQYRISEIVF